MERPAKIIGIGGVSTAGKSKLAKEIIDFCQGKKSILLNQDDFVFPENELPGIRDRIDWELPRAYDFDALENAIIDASASHELVIAEGLLIFHHQAIKDLFQKKIFIEIPKEAFMTRKLADNRWGDEPAWYLEHIWESYNSYGLIGKKEPDTLYLDGNASYSVERIINWLSI